MYNSTSARRGSTMTLTVVVAVILTGLVAALAWIAGEQSQQTSNFRQSDQAFYAAEAGAQRVAWYCKKGQLGTISSPLTGTLNGYAYSVSWKPDVGNAIFVQSVGSAGKISYTLSQIVTPPNLAPAIATGGDFDNKNIDVYGNVTVGGVYNNAGTGSVNGDLTYYGSATGTGNVTGTVTHASGTFTPIDMTALGNKLIAAAGTTYTGTFTGTNFDFTLLSGTNKVIYVNGSVVNPTFTGAGTLYVSGDITVDNFGTAANPVNLVCGGNITTNNNVTNYGTIYSGGSWARGKFTITGIVYVAKDVGLSNYAQSTVTQTLPPWFDPRGTGWSTVYSIGSFSGPQP